MTDSNKTDSQYSDDGTLNIGEYHPAANDAMRYVRKNLDMLTKEAIYSTAISGSRQSEILAGTMHRLENGDGVSDRYIMGLAIALMAIKGHVDFS